jgi:uncharacterized YccA/Bax inhibitor family protein
MANPVLTAQFGTGATADAALQTVTPAPQVITGDGTTMTIADVLQKTGILFLLVLVRAVYGWVNAETISGILIVSLLVTLGALIVTVIRPW